MKNKGWNKSGQVTIFIIIAILVVGGAALFFTFKGGFKQGGALSPELVPVANFVEECLEESLESVLFQVGENAGYYSAETAPSKTAVLEFPYYIENNKNVMPSKEKIENEISKYTARELFLCLNDFTSFQEHEITKGQITAETTMKSEEVLIKINYPLTIKKGESVSRIEDFSSEIPVRLGIIYDIISGFIEEDLKVEGLCLDCLISAMEEENLKSTVTSYGEGVYIIIIEDPLSEINKKKFLYVFANEYQ